MIQKEKLILLDKKYFEVLFTLKTLILRVKKFFSFFFTNI